MIIINLIIKQIHEDSSKDINIMNEPFNIFGKLVPEYTNEKWHYSVIEKEEKKQMCFPDENYNFTEMKKEYLFVGAYHNEKCIGLAIFKKDFFKYLYLYDLKVKSDYRKEGVATKLIDYGKELARSFNSIGIYTQAQDNNLAACLFYLRVGFTIGGLDTNLYKGTPQADKKDIIFYLDV